MSSIEDAWIHLADVHQQSESSRSSHMEKSSGLPQLTVTPTSFSSLVIIKDLD